MHARSLSLLALLILGAASPVASAWHGCSEWVIILDVIYIGGTDEFHFSAGEGDDVTVWLDPKVPSALYTASLAVTAPGQLPRAQTGSAHLEVALGHVHDGWVDVAVNMSLLSVRDTGVQPYVLGFRAINCPPPH